MHYTNSLSGTPSQHDRPEWEPLVDLLGPDLAGWFMWMCEIELADGSGLHAYKHVTTRRYLHLTEDGRAFLYSADGRYREIDRQHAIAQAFLGWERLCPLPADTDALRVTLRRAGPAPASRPTT